MPPVAALNHTMVAPAGGVAEMVTVPVPHLDAGDPVGGSMAVPTVAVTATLVEDTHPVVRFLVSA